MSNIPFVTQKIFDLFQIFFRRNNVAALAMTGSINNAAILSAPVLIIRSLTATNIHSWHSFGEHFFAFAERAAEAIWIGNLNRYWPSAAHNPFCIFLLNWYGHSAESAAVNEPVKTDYSLFFHGVFCKLHRTFNGGRSRPGKRKPYRDLRGYRVYFSASWIIFFIVRDADADVLQIWKLFFCRSCNGTVAMSEWCHGYSAGKIRLFFPSTPKRYAPCRRLFQDHCNDEDRWNHLFYNVRLIRLCSLVCPSAPSPQYIDCATNFISSLSLSRRARGQRDSIKRTLLSWYREHLFFTVSSTTLFNVIVAIGQPPQAPVILPLRSRFLLKRTLHCLRPPEDAGGFVESFFSIFFLSLIFLSRPHPSTLTGQQTYFFSFPSPALRQAQGKRERGRGKSYKTSFILPDLKPPDPELCTCNPIFFQMLYKCLNYITLKNIFSLWGSSSTLAMFPCDLTRMFLNPCFLSRSSAFSIRPSFFFVSFSPTRTLKRDRRERLVPDRKSIAS